jgi:dCTP deaminase
MLSDVQIRELVEQGAIVVDPFPEDRDFQPASLDVHLGNRWTTFRGIPKNSLFVDPLDPEYQLSLTEEMDCFFLAPGQFVLGMLKENIELPDFIVARIEGKSSLGRMGIAVHITAGFVDPGWKGHLTIELYNFSPYSYKLTAGMRIAQLAFDRLDTPARRPYGHPDLGSRYQNAEGPDASKGVG